MEWIFMQFLCTWQYQRVDTHQKLCTAVRSSGPSAEPVCKNAWWFWFVFQRLWTTSLGASVTPNTRPMARCRRYPEFRRKRINIVYESNIYININIYAHPPKDPLFAESIFVQLQTKTQKTQKNGKKNENKQKTKRNKKKQKTLGKLWLRQFPQGFVFFVFCFLVFFVFFSVCGYLGNIFEKTRSIAGRQYPLFP